MKVGMYILDKQGRPPKRIHESFIVTACASVTALSLPLSCNTQAPRMPLGTMGAVANNANGGVSGALLHWFGYKNPKPHNCVFWV